MNRSEKYFKRRANLKALSKVAKMAIESGATEASHVNEWILDFYREENPEIEEFNTFHQWKEKGFSIKKGSEAFVIWGKPRKVEAPDDSESDDDEYKYWPLCYLFSDQQVTERRYHEAEV